MISDTDPTQDLSSHYRLPDSALVTLLNFKKGNQQNVAADHHGQPEHVVQSGAAG